MANSISSFFCLGWMGAAGWENRGRRARGGRAIGTVNRNKTENPAPPSPRTTRKRRNTESGVNGENGETLGTTAPAVSAEAGPWDRTGATAAAGVTDAIWDQRLQHQTPNTATKRPRASRRHQCLRKGPPSPSVLAKRAQGVMAARRRATTEMWLRIKPLEAQRKLRMLRSRRVSG